APGSPWACALLAVVVEDGAARLAAPAGGAGRDGRDLPGGGVTAGGAHGEVNVVEQGGGQVLAPGGDGRGAAVLGQALQQADDAGGAAEQVLGHGAFGQHPRPC